MDIEFTPGQEKALAVLRSLAASDKPQMVRIMGYAGTGKTFLLSVLVTEFGSPIFLAPTGKAALRIKESTGVRASTIHSWIYAPVENKSTGLISFEKKPTSEVECTPNRMVVVDESSMITEEVYTQLAEVVAELKCHLVLVGDPFQLPPVDPGNQKPFSVLGKEFGATCDTTVMLTDIVRQAQDNPIIRVSLELRKGNASALKDLPCLDNKKSWLFAVEGMKAGNSTVLCHTNKMRHNINKYARNWLKRGNTLEAGEPLLIMRNCYGANVYNGEIREFSGWDWESEPQPYADKYKPGVEDTLTLGRTKLGTADVLLIEKRVRGEIDAYSTSSLAYFAKTVFQIYNPNVARSRKKSKFSSGAETPGVPYVDANFGYCLTAHKAQGSQWERVLVLLEPSVRLSEEEGLRWSYTAVTRSTKDVVLHWT